MVVCSGIQQRVKGKRTWWGERNGDPSPSRKINSQVKYRSNFKFEEIKMI
jgi:hypothetical protein